MREWCRWGAWRGTPPCARGVVQSSRRPASSCPSLPLSSPLRDRRHPVPLLGRSGTIPVDEIFLAWALETLRTESPDVLMLLRTLTVEVLNSTRSCSVREPICAGGTLSSGQSNEKAHILRVVAPVSYDGCVSVQVLAILSDLRYPLRACPSDCRVKLLIEICQYFSVWPQRLLGYHSWFWSMPRQLGKNCACICSHTGRRDSASHGDCVQWCQGRGDQRCDIVQRCSHSSHPQPLASPRSMPSSSR